MRFFIFFAACSVFLFPFESASGQNSKQQNSKSADSTEQNFEILPGDFDLVGPLGEQPLLVQSKMASVIGGSGED